jgi:hypothetical protein
MRRPRIYQPSPWWVGLLKLVVAVGLMGVLSWYAFDYGRARAGFDRVAAKQELRQVDAERARLEETNADLRQRVALLERTGQVEQQTSLEAKDQLRMLQEDITRLKEELAFYQTLVTPGEAQSGIRLQSLKIRASGDGGAYSYKLVLSKVLKSGQVVEGVVRLAVEGGQGGKPKSLPLETISPEGIAEHKFKFKYFQNFEGTLKLPDDFEPASVRVEAIPKGRDFETLVKVFDWSVS